MHSRRPDQSADGPILVVSNRLPVTFQRGPKGIERRRSSGGLVSALEPVLQKRGGVWIGWAGMELRSHQAGTGDEPYELRFVHLTGGEVNSYYHGFANRTLWPLFHCFPGRTRFDRREWQAYQRVNERFAQVTAEASGEAELVWVHDYQLMLTPLYLRPHLEKSHLAFFLHIPFPPFDLFRLLPWDRELLRGLLACDVIGFHVEAYARNFLDSVERLLGARVDRSAMLIEQGERTVRVGAFPIGIDFDHYESLARAAPACGERMERLVLGVDRLDYTKGIPERLRAFERLLELHPEHREKVALLQIAVPSRSQVAEYRELKREIDELVGRVNGRFGTASWSPIRYLYRSFPPERLTAMYRDADVGFLTPLRDGMNLVAKEFVACQVGNPGVLVLSRLAGAAETMREALHVNPYDIDGTAHALHRALTMDETERRSRLTALRRRERRRDVHAWVESFLDAAMAGPVGLRPPEAPDFEAWFGDAFFTGHRLALFLDYDGTLTPLCAYPAQAVLSPEMRAVLMACVRRPDTDVAVISGRALSDVMNLVDEKDVTYAGSHGMEISLPDGSSFQHEDLPYFQSKTDALAAVLAKTAPPGSWSERKGATLTFHFRQVDAELQAKSAARARALINAAGFQARDAHFAVEAVPPVAWDKGRAVLHILRTRYGPDWPEHVRAVYVGDDLTDEDAFRILGGLGFTFRVGTTETPTVAARRLPDVDTVRRLIEWLARRPSAASAGDGEGQIGGEPPARTA